MMAVPEPHWDKIPEQPVGKKLHEKSREEAHEARAIARALEPFNSPMTWRAAASCSPGKDSRALDELALPQSRYSMFPVRSVLAEWSRSITGDCDPFVSHRQGASLTPSNMAGDQAFHCLAAGRTRVLWISDNGIGLGTTKQIKVWDWESCSIGLG
jgi:hypothetical protein